MPAHSSSETVPPLATTTTSAHHGLLLTFRRPDALRHHLQVLAAQDAALDTLLIVDNDADPAIADLVAQHGDAAGRVDYLGVPDNPGPAGGIAAGIARILADAADDDWLVLFDDDDPPQRHDTLAALRDLAVRLTSAHEQVGGVALWGARLRPSGRLRVATGSEPESVDYLPGGGSAHYAIAALRASRGHDADLFFGFDDLDLGLGLRDAGWSLWSSGLARDHGVAHMVDDRTASAALADPSWRRYYSVRNHILVLRRHGRPLGAIVFSAVGVLKPVMNLPRRPRKAATTLRLHLRAVTDGWLGRSGKRFDPTDLPDWLR